MAIKKLRLKKLLRKLKKSIKRYLPLYISGILLLLIGASLFMQSQPSINPAAYTPLLNTIAEGESNGNYNAHFGNAANTNTKFVDMSIEEVLEWQKEFVAQGNPSNAVGRYQIIQPTLESLIRELNLNTQERFSPSLQDALAISLMERRGSIEFASGKLSAESFALELSKEWAALPRVIGDDPTASYYAGDGLNASHVKNDEILSAINTFKDNTQ